MGSEMCIRDSRVCGFMLGWAYRGRFPNRPGGRDMNDPKDSTDAAQYFREIQGLDHPDWEDELDRTTTRLRVYVGAAFALGAGLFMVAVLG